MDKGVKEMTACYKIRIFMVVFAVLFLLSGCGLQKEEFSGNKTVNTKEYELEFDILNTTYTHEMTVGKEEYIDVQIKKDAGNMSVEILDDNGNRIYKGDDVSSGEFTVSACEPGNYTFSISGEKAKGYVRFSVGME